MLLLYPVLIFLISRFINLYIPLCFYYIVSANKIRHLLHHPLHSTMLLLYPNCCKVRIVNVYGFTFHYASTISIIPQPQTKPVAHFTFHYASTISFGLKGLNLVLSNFTFHYASTISCPLVIHFLPPFAFTFHYASTISRIWLSFLILYRALHSTMLLLYQRRV